MPAPQSSYVDFDFESRNLTHSNWANSWVFIMDSIIEGDQRVRSAREWHSSSEASLNVQQILLQPYSWASIPDGPAACVWLLGGSDLHWCTRKLHCLGGVVVFLEGRGCPCSNLGPGCLLLRISATVSPDDTTPNTPEVFFSESKVMAAPHFPWNINFAKEWATSVRGYDGWCVSFLNSLAFF